MASYIIFSLCAGDLTRHCKRYVKEFKMEKLARFTQFAVPYAMVPQTPAMT